jgi:soluble cytochrome b562
MDIPPTLTHLIALNVEFHVLLCLGNGCRKAVSPAGIVEHLRKKHSTKPEIRKQVQGYIKEFPFTYDYSTVQLPVDRSAPQPIIPIMDGFQCKECPYKTRDRSNIRKHANQIHNKKRIADDEIFDSVRLQSWFQDSRERYWVVDESKQDEQERQAQRANIQDVGEESEESEESEAPSDNEIGQDEINDQIVQEIENWKAEAQERRLRALKNVPVVEMDSWLQYTKWNEVLCQSKHNMIKTLRFTREPDPDEVELSRVLRAWNRILERCLDTLAATDQKDALKWWASPKSEAASQNPFELPQNAKSVEKYSGIIEGFICYAMRTAPANWEDETGELI